MRAIRKQLVDSDRLPLYGAVDDEFTIFQLKELSDLGSNMTVNSGNGVNGMEMDKGPKEKIKYPKSVFFIISNEFCERFSYYGMRSVLALYLRNALQYDENTSTIIYHVFVMLCYFTPVFGGIMADAWLGKFKTILYVSIVYAVGNIVLAFGSVESINIPHKELSLIGLLLIALGTGGIKPCVSSFGGDQFVLPQQEKQLERFFSVFYFSINAGSVISSFLTPELRELKCLGSTTDCFPFAFGLPAILMIVALVVFICGYPMYKKSKLQGNIAVEVSACSFHAISRKMKSNEKKDHWLDYADDKYSRKLIDDIKVLMKLIVLFSPTIVFWALFEQQGSKWTFQATHLQGDVGGFEVQPDQMQTLNAVLVLIFIPLFQAAVYPLLAAIRVVRTPLQKLCAGGFLAAIAFVISGILQLQIQNDIAPMPNSGNSQLHIYNSLSCNATIKGPIDAEIPAYGHTLLNNLEAGSMDIIVTNCVNESKAHIVLNKDQISSYLLLSSNANETLLFELNVNGRDELIKSDSSSPKFKVIYSGLKKLDVELTNGGYKEVLTLNESAHQSSQKELTLIGKYYVAVDSYKTDVYLKNGGVYVLMLDDISGEMKSYFFIIANPNSISILWQIPQYIVITCAEIMFSITGLEFSYSQSPESLKSIISSLWLLTDALGNVIILIIEGFKISNAVLEMFIYAAVMVLSMLVFTFLAIRYKYTKLTEEDPDEKDQQEQQTRI